jgi:hypothetical protein
MKKGRTRRPLLLLQLVDLLDLDLAFSSKLLDRLAVAHAVFDELAHQVNLVIGQLRANFFFAFRL